MELIMPKFDPKTIYQDLDESDRKERFEALKAMVNGQNQQNLQHNMEIGGLIAGHIEEIKQIIGVYNINFYHGGELDELKEGKVMPKKLNKDISGLINQIKESTTINETGKDALNGYLNEKKVDISKISSLYRVEQIGR